MSKDDLLTPEAAAEALGISVETLRVYARENPPRVEADQETREQWGRLRFRRSEIERYASERNPVGRPGNEETNIRLDEHELSVLYSLVSEHIDRVFNLGCGMDFTNALRQKLGAAIAEVRQKKGGAQ